MKKIIVFLALCASFQSFAGGPSVKDLAATDKVILADIQAIKVQLLERDSALDAQSAIIDSLQSFYVTGKPLIKKPVESKDDLTVLLGFLLGVITYIVNNVLYKIQGFKEWVEAKFSKSAVTVSLGVLATAIAVITMKLNGSSVGWQETALWLVSSWGTHFGTFVMQAQKQVKA